jgi:hypothetical protein
VVVIASTGPPRVGTIAGIGDAAHYAASVPKPAKPEPPTPTGESESDRFVRESPLLHKDEDSDLGEGESELICIAPQGPFSAVRRGSSR